MAGARVRPSACACEIVKGNVLRPCLIHVRWHRQKMQPARRVMNAAVPDDKTDPHTWYAERDRLNRIIETEE